MDEEQKPDKTVWEIRGDRLHFLKEKKEGTDIPSIRMITTSLEYATELNRIIWAKIRTLCLPSLKINKKSFKVFNSLFQRERLKIVLCF